MSKTIKEAIETAMDDFIENEINEGRPVLVAEVIGSLELIKADFLSEQYFLETSSSIQ